MKPGVFAICAVVSGLLLASVRIGMGQEGDPRTVVIIASMASGESAQTWLEKGAEAYANMRLQDAGHDFEKAVEADPNSAKAHLSLGVVHLFQYQNGISMQPELPPDYLETLKNWKPGSPPPEPPNIPPVDPATKRARIAEQNATNATKAEKHLKRALELEPHDELAMEYLAALYFWWLDPATGRRARRDDARQWYARIAEINPQHRYANYVCGIIDYEKAFAIIRSTSGFPRPLADEESRRSLRAKVGPLLKDSAANFLRSLEVDPTNSDPMIYLGNVRNDESYIAETVDESTKFRAEAYEWYRKVDQIMAARAKAAGQPWPPSPGQTVTITFERIPQAGKLPVPTFPPDSRFMIPLAPPPPPPAFRR